ncbi:hypothetical protein [Bacillus sp. FJAT-45350]|uniref:hypothetical protein n=1 Tax=Bacillus sp. FJAT-45350 TaxID=2011014 RepID=UPI000BB8D294|nr:hypothetical protein [Bacillus sp. FJAT-45350]
MKRICSIIVVGSLLFGSGQAFGCEKLEDESLKSVQVESLHRQQAIEVSVEKKERSLKVNHQVKGKDVYIECIVNDFSFSKDNAGKLHNEGEGHLQLYVDGQKVDSIYQAAFIVKGLPQGNHEIKVELVRNNHEPYGIEEEFTVSIP